MRKIERPDILIVTTKVDVTADYVVLALQDRGVNFYRLNTEDLPEAAMSSFKTGEDSSIQWRWAGGSRLVDLSAIRAVWYRRHRLPLLGVEMSEGLKDFCLRECDWFLRGTLLAREVRWMSYPPAVAAAEAKLLQLAVAKKLGIAVPRTLVTNDPTDAREFCIEEGGRIIAKVVRAGYVDDGVSGMAIFSNLVTLDELAAHADDLRLAPVIFQQFIDKVYDLRITIVGDQIFPARIDSQAIESAKIDWRRSETDNLPHAVAKLPDDISRGCLALIKRLGLAFGAIDMAVDRDGRHYFLEVNPSGQWAWLQDRLGFDIAGAISDWLVGATAS